MDSFSYGGATRRRTARDPRQPRARSVVSRRASRSTPVPSRDSAVRERSRTSDRRKRLRLSRRLGRGCCLLFLLRRRRKPLEGRSSGSRSRQRRAFPAGWGPASGIVQRWIPVTATGSRRILTGFPQRSESSTAPVALLPTAIPFGRGRETPSTDLSARLVPQIESRRQSALELAAWRSTTSRSRAGTSRRPTSSTPKRWDSRWPRWRSLRRARRDSRSTCSTTRGAAG